MNQTVSKYLNKKITVILLTPSCLSLPTGAYSSASFTEGEITVINHKIKYTLFNYFICMSILPAGMSLHHLCVITGAGG